MEDWDLVVIRANFWQENLLFLCFTEVSRFRLGFSRLSFYLRHFKSFKYQEEVYVSTYKAPYAGNRHGKPKCTLVTKLHDFSTTWMTIKASILKSEPKRRQDVAWKQFFKVFDNFRKAICLRVLPQVQLCLLHIQCEVFRNWLLDHSWFLLRVKFKLKYHTYFQSNKQHSYGSNMDSTSR